ncbi:MAG TPA: hypothetical protein VMT22_14005 [Terriglobales bacterium]|jgi:hypothetical protein|nr:hypothetical protein [Terriglobales bacterium]
MADHNAPVSGAPGHELSDLDPKKIGWFGIALALLMIAVVAVSYLLFDYFYTTVSRARPQPSPLSYSREPTPEPRLSVKPGDELKALRTEETKLLEGYDWIDRDRGIVRIPIARAIDILAQRGLPARNEKSEAPAAAKEAPRRKGTERR